MNPPELLILSFFDKDIPKKMDDKDLTSEMIEAGIGSNAAAKYAYFELVHQLKNKGLLVLFKDPSKPQKGITRAIGPELLVLSEKALEILNRDKEKKVQEAFVTELEFKKLKTEYDLLAYQLVDYDETKKQAKNSYKVSIWSLIVAIISAIAAVIAIIQSGKQ